MDKKLVIYIAKYVSSLAIATTIGCIAQPAIREFFGLKKKEKPATIPAEDITFEEVSDDE
jgi:hypothetical protein